MEAEPTFIDHELLYPMFIRDLRVLLSLPEDALQDIARIRLSTGGDPGYRDAVALSRRFSISADQGAACLRIADHLVHVSRQAGLAPNEAARQIAMAASEIDDPIEVSNEQIDAVAAIMSFGGSETSEPISIVGLGPRSLSVTGSWVIKVDRTADGATVPVPWVNFGLSWSATGGATHEVSFEISEAEWESFQGIIAGISSAKSDLIPFLERHLGPHPEEVG